MLERTIETYFIAAARRLGAYALKMVVLSWRGWPDRLVLAPGGKIFFVEFKRPGASPRRNQTAVHKLIRSLGFRIYVVASQARAEWVLAKEFKR